MSDPRRIRPDEVEIVVARELRKAGVQLTGLAALVERGRRSPEPNDTSQYVMELGGPGLLVEFRNEASLAGADVVRALAQRPANRPAQRDAPKRLLPTPDAPPAAAPGELRVLVSTTGFEPAAVVEAKTLGMPLLRVADGQAAFRRSQWAMGEQPPAWVPEYMAELADIGPDNAVRYDLITGPVRALSPARR